MDNKTEILLNSRRNIGSVNIDMAHKIELSNVISEINEYRIDKVINASDVFDSERQENSIYRIYGKIEFMSLLNGLKKNYGSFRDFFLPQKSFCKTILNSFKFYLVRPSSDNNPYTKISTDDTTWIRFFEIVTTPNNFRFDLYPAGFSNNIYGEQEYIFNFNIDIDISNYYDYFNFPLTELFLYAKYIPTSTNEKIYISSWNISGIKEKVAYDTTYINENDGDVLKTNTDVKIGDLIEYNKSQFHQAQKTSQIFYISTPYTENLTTHAYSITFNCYVNAEAWSSEGDVVGAETIALISINNGDDWIQIVRAKALAKNGNAHDIDEKEIKYTINNIGYNDLTNIKVKIEGNYAPDKESMGGGTIKIENVLDTTGGRVDVKCNNIYEFNYDSATLNCDIPSQPPFASTYIFFDEIINNIGSINKTSPQEETLKWKYCPLIPLNLRYFSSSLNQANSGTSYYDIVQSIPTYATKFDNTNNYIWRDIQPEGYFDPLTGIGNDIPFINKRRYFFTSIILDVVPDMDDEETRNKFSEIWYTKNAKVISKTPTGDINDLGKPCK